MAHRIAIVPGDGIGQEVIPAAVEVLQATGVPFELVAADAGFGTFERTRMALPPETLAIIRDCRVALFGATASPLRKTPGYASPIIAMRRQFDLYANLRPILSAPVPSSRPGIDIMMVRENTEGLYVQREERVGDTATAVRLITRRASVRIGRIACQLAMARRRHLTIVHKANVLPETCGLFRDAVLVEAASFPELRVDEVLADAMAMRLITTPEAFDVVVTTNMFGDILTDEAAALVGGLGLAASGNIGPEVAIFEPMHGSAPDIAGRGIANPVAAIQAAAMLLEHIGERPAAQRVRQAVWRALEAGHLTPDLGGKATTIDVTRAVIEGL